MDMRSLRHHRRTPEMGLEEEHCPPSPSTPPSSSSSSSSLPLPSPSPSPLPSPSPSPSNNAVRGIERLVSKLVRDLKSRRESLATRTGVSMSLVQLAASSPLAWIPPHSSPTPRVSPSFLLRQSKPLSKPSPRSSPSPATRMAAKMMPPLSSPPALTPASSPSFTQNPIDPGRNLEEKGKSGDNAGAEVDKTGGITKTGEKIALRVFGNWVTLSMMAMCFLCTGKGAALGITMSAFLIFRLIYLLNPGVKSIISSPSSLPPASPPGFGFGFLPPRMEPLGRNDDQPEQHQKPRKKKSSLRASIRSLTIQVPKRQGLANNNNNKPQKPLAKAASLPSRFVLVEKPSRSFRPQAGESWVINETAAVNMPSGRWRRTVAGRRRSVYEAFPVIGFIVLGMVGLLYGHITAIAVTSSWLLLLSKLTPYLGKSCYGHTDSFPHASSGSPEARSVFPTSGRRELGYQRSGCKHT